MTTGNPGTSLAETLGLARGMRIWFGHVPEALRDAIHAAAPGLEEESVASQGLQLAILCQGQDGELTRELSALYTLLAPAGAIWIVWSTDSPLAVDRVRAIALPVGLADTHAGTIAPDWEGMRLVALPTQR
jgi:hypothetical protein